MDDRCESEGCDMRTTYEDEHEWYGECSRCGAEGHKYKERRECERYADSLHGMEVWKL